MIWPHDLEPSANLAEVLLAVDHGVTVESRVTEPIEPGPLRVREPHPPGGVTLVVDGPVARLNLARPERHNALEAEDVAVFLGHLDAIEVDPTIRVLVLTATGDDTFCAGAALHQMESGEMSGLIFDGLTGRLAGIGVPTVCVLNGSVYGGGAELALCCDFRIGADDIRLSVPAARLGVCYPVGGLTRYIERLGLATANRILLSAEELDAREMQRVGFLTHCVPREHLKEEANLLVTRLASLAPLAVQAMKRILLDVAGGRLDAEAAARAIDVCATSADLKEGLAAHRERRPPAFEGR